MIYKSDFRHQAAQRRKNVALTTNSNVAAQALRHQFCRYIPPEKERFCIAGYLPIGSEINILPLLNHLLEYNWTITLPCIVAKEAPLLFRQWHPGDPLIKEEFGTSAPLPGSPEHHPDFILTPLLAFDRTGRRMGYGGGFYDRTIEKMRTHAKSPYMIGCAYAAQEYDTVPAEPHDQPLDYILTEKSFMQSKLSSSKFELFALRK